MQFIFGKMIRKLFNCKSVVRGNVTYRDLGVTSEVAVIARLEIKPWSPGGETEENQENVAEGNRLRASKDASEGLPLDYFCSEVLSFDSRKRLAHFG